MKRDMDLLRKILFYVEARPPFEHILATSIQLEGEEQDAIIYHTVQLIESGLLKGTVFDLSNGPPECLILSMAPEGHDFIDLARKDTLWEKAKERGKRVAGTLTIALMKTALTEEAIKALASAH
jgi:hypothetical protein